MPRPRRQAIQERPADPLPWSAPVIRLDPLPPCCPRCGGPLCDPYDRHIRRTCMNCGENVYYPNGYRGSR